MQWNSIGEHLGKQENIKFTKSWHRSKHPWDVCWVFHKMNPIHREKIHQSSTWHNIVLLFLRPLVYLQGNRRSLLAHDWISACCDAFCLTPGGWHSQRQDFQRGSHYQIYNKTSAGREAFLMRIMYAKLHFLRPRKGLYTLPGEEEYLRLLTVHGGEELESSAFSSQLGMGRLLAARSDIGRNTGSVSLSWARQEVRGASQEAWEDQNHFVDFIKFP